RNLTLKPSRLARSLGVVSESMKLFFRFGWDEVAELFDPGLCEFPHWLSDRFRKIVRVAVQAPSKNVEVHVP
ncbi:MAG: hypothetical protein WCH93_10695, partial [Actinomycetota bacterium]